MRKERLYKEAYRSPQKFLDTVIQFGLSFFSNNNSYVRQNGLTTAMLKWFPLVMCSEA